MYCTEQRTKIVYWLRSDIGLARSVSGLLGPYILLCSLTRVYNNKSMYTFLAFLYHTNLKPKTFEQSQRTIFCVVISVIFLAQTRSKTKVANLAR